MTQFIDKAILVTEINKRIMEALLDNNGLQRVQAYNDVKGIIDTIELKEMNLEKEQVDSVWHDKDEEPDEDKQILINLSGFCYVDFFHKEDKRFYMFGNPKHYLCEVDKWAYVCDLLCDKESAKVQHVNETCQEKGDYLARKPISEELEEKIKLNYNLVDGLEFEEFERIAKYFFELGLKVRRKRL